MKKIFLLLLCTWALILGGCAGDEIDNIAYVVAIGVDKAENGYEFTFAIGNPNGIGGGDEGGGDENVLIYEKQYGEDIFTAGEKVSSKTGQRLNFSHSELIVFAEDVATDGVEIFADGLTRNLNERPKLVTAVCNNAGQTLKSIKSKYESNPEKHLKKVFEAPWSESSIKTNSRDFLVQIKNTDTVYNAPYIDVDDSGIDIRGISVFKGGKTVCHFDDILSYKLIGGEAEDLSYEMSGVGTVGINQREKPRIYVDCKENPYISVEIPLECFVHSLSDKVEKEKLFELVKSSLTQRINSALNHSSKEAEIDYFGLERYGRKCFATWDDWQKYNWNEKFKFADFDVNITIKPVKTGLVKGGL